MKVIEGIGSVVETIRSYPTLSFLGATAITGLFCWGSFHQAGDYSQQRDALLASEAQATLSSQTYQAQSAHLVVRAEHAGKVGDLAKETRLLVGSNADLQAALAQSNEAASDASAADALLKNRENFFDAGLGTGIASIIALGSAGVTALRAY